MPHFGTFRALVCLIAAFAGTQSVAEPLARDWQDEEAWRYSITGYAFLPASTKGPTTVAGTTVELDLDLSDALDLLDGALAGRFEAWRGNYGLMVDLSYVNLGLDQGITLPIPPAPSALVKVDIEQGWIGLLGAYRVAHGTFGENGQRYSFDLQGGLRYNELKQEITITTPAPIPVLGGTETWWEPVIGARAMWEFNDRWSAALAADFGGFGAGGNDLQVGVNAGVRVSTGKQGSFRFGYRFYSMDFSTTRADGEFAYDVQQHGPYIGYTWNFQ